MENSIYFIAKILIKGMNQECSHLVDPRPICPPLFWVGMSEDIEITQKWIWIQSKPTMDAEMDRTMLPAKREKVTEDSLLLANWNKSKKNLLKVLKPHQQPSQKWILTSSDLTISWKELKNYLKLS